MPSEYAKTLGARLRAIRTQQGLSLHGVEEKSRGRWKAVVVGSYERGDRSVTVQKLAELAEFYGVPVSELLPGDSAPTPLAPSPKLVIDLAGGRGSRQTGLCRGTLAGAGGEVRRPFRESRLHLRQQLPDAVGLPAPCAAGLTAGSDQCRSGTQCGQMGHNVPRTRRRLVLCLHQTAPRGLQHA